MPDFAIGQLSAETGVKIPTIRYYEGIGLIEPPPRTDGNQRRYDETALERLKFIAHARAMGFPMAELRALLQLAGHRQAPCADLDQLVRGRLADVDQRITRLTTLRAELAGMLETGHHGTIAECRVVEVLSDHQRCASEH